MDADYRFWSTVKWLMENEDAYSFVDSHERNTLREALKQARRANRLTGIPTHAYGYVMKLAEEVKERIAAAQKRRQRRA
jgi:hypothetical protein